MALPGIGTGSSIGEAVALWLIAGIDWVVCHVSWVQHRQNQQNSMHALLFCPLMGGLWMCMILFSSLSS